MRAKHTVLITAIWIVSAGCGAHVSDDLYYAAVAQQETLTSLTQRAESELGCKSEKLDLQILERARHGDVNSPPTIVGITGCGQRAAYQREVEMAPTQDVRAMRNTAWMRSM
jgi:hypothetical protein